jgi:hypothetical protein
MKYSKYPIVASNDYVYWFFSEGPQGKIKKGVFYDQIGKNLFNLGFGDWNEAHQDVDDSSRSNNGDRDQVLATVASTALIFFNHFPNAQIFIEGGTPARTRLYQMGISRNRLEINLNFEVKGLRDKQWELFQEGQNYEAFLIKRK